MGKSQSEIISVVLIVLISIGLIGTVYTWGLPLMQKRRDSVVVERVKAYFDQSSSSSLPSLIEFVANTGGEATFSVGVDGIWTLHPATEASPYNNSISFFFSSKVSGIANDIGWISLTPSASCPPTFGLLGTDRASVVCARADTSGDRYNITYIVYFRPLNQTAVNKIYKIELYPLASAISTSRVLRIVNGGTVESSLGDKSLIITRINILLG